MKFRTLLLSGLCLFLGACATRVADNTTTFQFEGSSVQQEMVEVGAGKYKVTLAGMRQTKAQVERAYAFRVSQMCGGRATATPPEYVAQQARGPVWGPTPQNTAYTLAGVVTCPDAAGAPVAAVAVIRDSAKFTSQNRADIFYLSKIGETKIEDSYMRTAQRNAGQGMVMSTALVERNVPAQLATFTISGHTRYAAPILALTSGPQLLGVTGTVTFAPEQYKRYVVKGELGERYSAVWIEEELDGGGTRMVGNKVEQR